MNDLISRQDVINALLTIGFVWDDELSEPEKEELDYAIHGFVMAYKEMIEALPSAQPEQRWISCSERLPEPYQECLFTVEAFHWANEPVTYIVIQKAYGGERDFIAWMPLPEPYRKESE